MSNSTPRNPKIAVIGAGMSGILAAIKLHEAGIEDVQLFEKADRLGGTWRDNRYPGLSCDVPSHLYSYSFELNPDWSYKFSPGPEIHAYFEKVADKYHVRERIRFNAEVTRLSFDGQVWTLTTKDGFEDRYDFVICATGVLHHPKYPDIAGIEDFEGPIFHSARWQDGLSLKDKKIGIVGTGSTAIQITSAIVDEVAQLSLFQRTAQWVFPYPNPPFSEEDKENFRRNPSVMAHMHQSHSNQIATSFSRAVIGDEEQMQLIQSACEENLEENVTDPVLKAKLTPDYRAACKRLIMSDTFYDAIQHPNANLVDAGIERIETTGIRTKDGDLHELDIIVLATGFHAHEFMQPMEIVTNSGKRLSDHWADATPAYRSVALPGFPNLFMVLGPNSPIGNFSLIEIAEWQIGYLLHLINGYRSGDYRFVAPTSEATDAFNADVKAAMPDTIWVSGCQSWYLDKQGNPAMWPFSFERFCDDMQRPRLEEFELTG